jgi:hypothetical protein
VCGLYIPALFVRGILRGRRQQRQADGR